MEDKLNCWDYLKCGREEGGNKTAEMGVCPAATDSSSNGINDGKNGGRICWAVAGTFCGGKVQGTDADKHLSCMTCEFFKKVENEEGIGKFQILKPQQSYSK